MKNIVLVDDYEPYVECLKDFIEQQVTVNCVIFSSPIDALEYIRENKNVDILITDYQMPRMNGFELAKKVIEEFKKMRIIIASGHDGITLLNLGKEYGLNGKISVMTKGEDIDYVIQLINRS